MTEKGGTPTRPRIAVVTARAARGLDEDEGLLVAALEEGGAQAQVVDWDAADADWGAFDLALLRSTWDYTQRLTEFAAWVKRAAALTRLENPAALVRWNSDKRYLAQLARALPAHSVIPDCLFEPGDDIAPAVGGFLAREDCREVVVKPAVGAGSRDVERHRREAQGAITAHIQRLNAQGRNALLQPYLPQVEREGETALVFFDGAFSHSVRKGPMLGREGIAAAGHTALFAPEEITPREPAADELALAEQVLGALQALPLTDKGTSPLFPLLYARVDLIRDEQGRPRLLELELCEPSLFLMHSPGSAARLAAGVMRRASG